MSLRHLWDSFPERLRTLAPGTFAFVMATGILSTGELRFHATLASFLLLGAGVAGYLGLVVLFVLRCILHPAEMWADTARTDRAFAFFTFVAASNVLATRFAAGGLDAPAKVLAVVGALAWLALGYGILGRVVTNSFKARPEAATNGTWLIWVVGTQSVSIAASVIGARLGFSAEAAAFAAVSLWAFGAVLYLLLMAVILARLTLGRLRPEEATPPYWIIMGATAITVLAGAEILGLQPALRTLAAARSTVEGLTFLLWAFGTWWFPFLIVLTVWRHLRLARRRFEQALWSMVFPLGMYATASDAYGRAIGLGYLPKIAQVEIWLGLFAWVVVAGWMVVSWFTPAETEARAAAAASSMTHRAG